MNYLILKILEEDYGCEGVPEGEELLCRVLLQDESGQQVWKKIPDSLLTEQNLNEGDRIIL
ncbi:MAG: hypothetical protein IJJ69_14560 [Oscillospiraceae bacterium]|nr:hypothetical protein [Oscillospiraceae bacterium]